RPSPPLSRMPPPSATLVKRPGIFGSSITRPVTVHLLRLAAASPPRNFQPLRSLPLNSGRPAPFLSPADSRPPAQTARITQTLSTRMAGHLHEGKSAVARGRRVTSPARTGLGGGRRSPVGLSYETRGKEQCCRARL